MFSGSFIGRVGKDAKVIQGAYGDFLSMDVAESYFSHGETKTRWIRVRSSAPKCVKMAPYFTKGRQLEIVGELSDVTIWENSQGKPNIQLIVNAFRIEFASSGRKKDGQEQVSKPGPVSEAERAAAPKMPFEAPDENASENDLPF